MICNNISGFRNIIICIWPLLLLSCKKEPIFSYPPKPEVIVTSADQRFQGKNVHFLKDSVYILTTGLTIDSGKTLSIDAGTLVKVNTGIILTIKTGGTMKAAGTAAEPIVFTQNAAKGTAGIGVADSKNYWGGISIYGNPDGKTSGNIQYLRLEFAGANNNSALFLSGVSNQTVINNVQVSYSFSNAFEWSGGNCNAVNLVSFGSSGVDFYISNGYNGKLQNLLAFRDPELANENLNLSSLYIGGINSAPVISNLSVLRPGLRNGVSGNHSLGDPNRRAAVIAGDGSGFRIRNAVIIGLPSVRTQQNKIDTSAVRAFYLQSKATASSLDSGRSEFSNTIFFQSDSNAFYIPKNTYQNYNSADLREFLLRPQYRNEVFSSLDQFKFSDPFHLNYYYSTFNPLLGTSSPLLTGADFSGPAYSDSFFKKVGNRGAIGADNWISGWTNFLPLQTDYNN